jgi:hypothetical protein
MALIKLNRTKTGAVPTSLADGELFIDQLNGWLYYADATGVVRKMSLLGEANHAATADFATDAHMVDGHHVGTSGAAVSSCSGRNEWSAGQVGKPVVSGATVDLSLGNNFTITVNNTAVTLASPLNQVAGQSGVITITGASSIAFSSDWKFEYGAAPTAFGVTSAVAYYVIASGKIFSRLIRDIK